MFKSFGTEFKVGLFVIVALATLGYIFFVLNPSFFEDAEYKTYYTVLDNAAGIVPKTHVKTNGVTVGQVLHVNLKGLSTHVSLRVNADVQIPEGSTIQIRSQGLLGDVHLEIFRAQDKGKYIEDGGFIEQGKGAMDLNQLTELAGKIAEDIKKVTGVLARVLGSEEGEQALENIVDNIEGLTADLKATTTTLKNVIGGREEDLQDIVTNVRDGVADLREFASGLKEVLDEQNRERIDRILASFDETMVDVKGSARNINLVAEKIEKGEGTLGKLINDDTALAELEGAIKDIRKVLAPATKLVVEVDYHNEFRKDESSQHYFNVIFRTRPDRYYLLGVTDTAHDVITETEEPLDDHLGEPEDPDADPDPRRTTRRTISTEKALKFNLQVAKRWGPAALRFGIFESSGGIGADLFFFDDKLRFTLEAFNWDTQDATIRRTAHLKTYASVLFYNHIYLLAGIDDPTRTDPKSCAEGKCKVDKDLNYFFGAGLSFTDEDLKAIFGTAALAL